MAYQFAGSRHVRGIRDHALGIRITGHMVSVSERFGIDRKSQYSNAGSKNNFMNMDQNIGILGSGIDILGFEITISSSGTMSRP